VTLPRHLRYDRRAVHVWQPLAPRALLVVGAIAASRLVAGCGSEGALGGASKATATVGGASGSGGDGAAASSGRGETGGTDGTGEGGAGGGAPKPCTTRITYGDRWIAPPDHPGNVDVVTGLVTWDGLCALDGPNAVATLSNGWKPYFSGHDACALALDHEGDCGVPPSGCTTRIGYGTGWLAPPDHPAPFDDIGGAVFADGVCRNVGGTTRAMTLSNGWTPHFEGTCALAFRWTGCGGLYTNPVVATDCPDPGVLRDGDRYVMTCTGGAYGAVFPIRTSKDLIAWKDEGFVLPFGATPSWAVGDFWAPEIHALAKGYVAYFSARHANGRLVLGAATAPSATGPFTALATPLLDEGTVGHIDAHAFTDEGGARYLVWKDDGNAFGQPTPIWARKLQDDGLGFVGAKVQLLVNDLDWEGALVEGPWVVRNGGAYYLFYSANAFYDGSYAVGVARATSPLGPYTKHGLPILKTNGAWAGPGHGSVIVGPRGDWLHVNHAWEAGNVNAAPGRLVLVDRIQWSGMWPTMLAAPSRASRPLP
jgi:arabinan endo-1,5-alpha-L-arabinosidase